MLVVEDTVAGEVRRFIVVEALLQLGEVQAGAQSRIFDPNRVFNYYGMVEDQLLDYSGRYPEAFRYLPRRAYEYLKKPPVLSELYHNGATTDSGWFTDFFVARPLLSLGDAHLPLNQRKSNIRLVENWSITPPYSSRLYRLQDMRFGSRTRPGWGAALTAYDLKESLNNENRTDLVRYIKSNLPLFIEMDKEEEMDLLMEWLVFLKDARLETPSSVFSVRDHKAWSSQINRLMLIPNSKLLISGSTISSLATLISRLQGVSEGAEWSKRFVFGSGYPETQKGDRISEIMSYLLSANLNASPSDAQRILGGNLLSLLPPRPPYFEYSDNSSAVVSEGLLGKASIGELSRILRILAARKRQIVESFDYMISDEGGSINLQNAIVTVRNPIATTANTVILLQDAVDSLIIAGWRNAFSESTDGKETDPLTTIVRAAARSDGPVLNSPSHLNRFNYALLDCLRVKNFQEILSALHFKLSLGAIKKGFLNMSRDDMRAVGVSQGDYVLVLEPKVGQWWAGRVEEDEKCPQRAVCVSHDDAEILGLTDDSFVDLVKSEGKIAELEKAIFALAAKEGFSTTELISYAYLHSDRLRSSLDGKILGRGTSIWLSGKEAGVSMTLAHSVPPLEAGELGQLAGETLEFRLSQMFRPFNVVLCISTDSNMGVQDVQLKTQLSLRRRLEPLASLVPEIAGLLEGLGSKITRMELATLASMLTIQNLLGNRSEGSMGIVNFGKSASKFSIQKRESIQTAMRFSSDFRSEEVLVSMIYSLLDTSKDFGGVAKPSEAFRAVAEYLEDFGPGMPTLVLLFANLKNMGLEDAKPFLQAIAGQDRHQIEVLNLGEESSDLAYVLDGINANVHNFSAFAADVFEGYLADVIEKIVPSRLEFMTSDESSRP